MTLRAVGFGRAFPRAWLVPITAMTLLLGVAASGRLSRSVVADLIAWWPVWLGLAVAANFLRHRKVGPIRFAGLIPLFAFGFVLLFLWGHLAGWSIMPSASQRLVGPTTEGVAEASMTVSIDGEVDVDGASEFLYDIEPIRSGGRIGIPTATEEVSDAGLSISLDPPSEPGLYSYAGWDIRLAPSVVWDLRLDGAVEADLSGLEIAGVSLGGAGNVVLGSPAGETPVTVHGAFHLTVPEDTPVRVIGVASVPANWTPTDDGAVSPGLGAGWVLTVVGDSTLTVGEH